MASIIRTLINQSRDKEKNIYNSHLNYVFYGNTGKSSVSAALSTLTDEPVLLISPAGGSTYLEADFPNIISYPIANLNELRTLIDDLDKNMEIIRRLQLCILRNDQANIEKAKKYYLSEGENWEYIYDLGKNSKFPISAVVLEEASIVSSWIQNEVEEKLETVALGQDKKSMGSDWNILKREQMDFFSKLLKLPCSTILCTGSKLPTESQASIKIEPNLCVGSAQRQLIEMIGNIFYFFKEDDGKFKIRMRENKKIFAKDKLLSPYSSQQVPEELDVTNKPELFWTTLNEMKKKDREEQEQRKNG